MNEQDYQNYDEEQIEQFQNLATALPKFPNFPFPPGAASGLYGWSKTSFPLPIPIPFPGPGLGKEIITLTTREELRLDVDGYYPQMVASGTRFVGLTSTVHWIANLTAIGEDLFMGTVQYKGTIWYKDGDVKLFPYTDVEINVVRSWFPSHRSATVTFLGAGAAPVRTFKFKSPYFHTVDFEFDFAEGEVATTSVDTCAHPNHPATLPCQNLSLQTVYERAGFDVTTSPGGPVLLSGAGPDALWSDMEMHDAMQTFWSHFAAQGQWAMGCFLLPCM
jgi:hypothetical protein